MTEPLKLTTKKRTPEKEMNVQFILTVAFVCAFLISGVWYMISFSNNHTTANADSTAADESERSGPFTGRGSRKLAAYEMRKKLLEEDAAQIKKYRRTKKQRSDEEKPDNYKARRSWRDELERRERAYRQFKDDPTTDANSVKVQMQKRIQQLKDDAPLR